jgi:hypothetical protein
MVCRGAEGGEEASGMLVVTRDFTVVMLVVAGVAPALVGGGKRGEGRRLAGLTRPWALATSWAVSGQEEQKERERERAGRATCWPWGVAPRWAGSGWLLTHLTPHKLGCHPWHGARGAGINKCKCSSRTNMKSASAQIIPM